MRGLALRRPDLQPVAGQADGLLPDRPARQCRLPRRQADQPVRHRLGRLPDRRRGDRGQRTRSSAASARRPPTRRSRSGITSCRGSRSPSRSTGRTTSPARPIKGRVQADYVFGKPVTDGAVSVALETEDLRPPALATAPRSRTDAIGAAAFELRVPDTLIGREQDAGAARSPSPRPSATPPARRRAVPRPGSSRRSRSGSRSSPRPARWSRTCRTRSTCSPPRSTAGPYAPG